MLMGNQPAGSSWDFSCCWKRGKIEITFEQLHVGALSQEGVLFGLTYGVGDELKKFNMQPHISRLKTFERMLFS